MKSKVIFICTGNSCRSQMAEGLLRTLAGDRYEVYSAGLKPSVVNPRAIHVMKEIGTDISGHQSKSVEQYLEQPFDYIITVCDNANETCPYFPGSGKRIHWSFTDPADATGTEEEILSEFRKIRDQIKSGLENFIRE
jgi:arsenate reductase (thioredoxin)